jgi:hypothetical protein
MHWTSVHALVIVHRKSDSSGLCLRVLELRQQGLFFGQLVKIELKSIP